MSDARRQRLKTLGVFGLAANGDGEQGAAMKRLAERNDLALFRPEVIGGVFTSQLERGFIRFRARIGEEHPLGKGQIAQSLSQPERRFIRQHIADVPQLLRLFG